MSWTPTLRELRILNDALFEAQSSEAASAEGYDLTDLKGPERRMLVEQIHKHERVAGRYSDLRTTVLREIVRRERAR